METITEEEEQEIAANCQIVQEQTNLWGSKKLREREQEDKLTRSSLPKITGTIEGSKREQEEEKGARRKKAKHKREPDHWGETEEQDKLAEEQNLNSQVSLNLSSPNCQLPPLEHIVWPKRSRQASLRELLTGKVGALKGEPPESAGRDTPTKPGPSSLTRRDIQILGRTGSPDSQEE